MNIAVASFRGGDGKTTTAMHLAAYLQTLAPTLLLDSGSNLAATAWTAKGQTLPFQVASARPNDGVPQDFDHLVIDTGPSLSNEDLKALAEQCDLVVMVAGLRMTYPERRSQLLAVLAGLNTQKYRVLVTGVPPSQTAAIDTLNEEMIDPLQALEEMGIPAFNVAIPRLKVFETAAAAGAVVSAMDSTDAAHARASYVAVGKQITVLLASGK